MKHLWSIRAPVSVVIALFLGSLVMLLVQSFAGLRLSQREADVRNEARAACQSLARAAAPLTTAMPSSPESLDQTLHDLTVAVLSQYPEVEGGFFLAVGSRRFSGFAFPTGSHYQPQFLRNDPPPLETPHIRSQAIESLPLTEDETLIDVRDIGHSRVLVATSPAGSVRPARMVAWTMVRLTRPADLSRELQRIRVSVVLALVGMAFSLCLTFNLGRSLKRQRLEQERLRDELRRTEHLAALGKLLAGVAHEVRNPLAGIRSTVQLWQRIPGMTQERDSQEAVIQAVDRLNDIVRRLLYFSRADHSEREPISAKQVFTETLSLLEAQALEQQVNIIREFEPNLPEISGSPAGLRQVFLNLATNALQAMPAGGTLRCRILRSQHRSVEIQLIDTGCGISAEDQQHLFEPFFTTRPEGTGLGLALCREIVNQHGGTIAIESSPGQGTTVCLTLPAIG